MASKRKFAKFEEQRWIAETRWEKEQILNAFFLTGIVKGAKMAATHWLRARRGGSFIVFLAPRRAFCFSSARKASIALIKPSP